MDSVETFDSHNPTSSELRFKLGRTHSGKLKLIDSLMPCPGNFRLLKESGEKYLDELGIREGMNVPNDVYAILEIGGDLHPVPGSISGNSLQPPPDILRSLRRNDSHLRFTSRSHANRLGWRVDSYAIRSSRRPRARELAFSEVREELYFFVFSPDLGQFTTYHLLESAVEHLLKSGIKVGDAIHHDLQFWLITQGHLYTDRSGQTGN